MPDDMHITELQISTAMLIVECPKCGENTEGFIGDPRGHQFECDGCGETVSVTEDATVTLY